MLVKAFDDYLKGPDFIKNQDPESLHSNILKLSKSYKNQNLQQNYSPPYQLKQNSRSASLKKFISLLTLNGHLLPNCFTSNDDAFIWRSPGYPGQVSSPFNAYEKTFLALALIAFHVLSPQKYLLYVLSGF